MASIVYTVSNLAVKVDPAYCPVNGDIQYSYAVTKFSFTPAEDTLTGVTLNGTAVTNPWGGARDFTSTQDLNGKTPAQLLTSLNTMFPVKSYPAGVLNADIALVKDGASYAFITSSYGKNISGTATTSGTTTLAFTVDTTGAGPVIASAAGLTAPNTGTDAFVGAAIPL